jgi:hypothetical protein
MATTVDQEHFTPGEHRRRMYEASLLPTLQALLAALADIEFAHEYDTEAVRNSSTDELLKRTILQKLEAQHRKRCAPYLQQIRALQQRTKNADSITCREKR